MLIALVVWLATARGIGGEITVETLSNQWVSFAGNAAAIISGGILSISLSLWRPANFDWEKTRNIAVVKEIELGREHDDKSRSSGQSIEEEIAGDPEKTIASLPTPHLASSDPAIGMLSEDLDMNSLQQSFKRYTLIFSFLALVITIVSRELFWPFRV